MQGDTEIPHGGALDDAAAQFGVPADGWLDLSTGINPMAYPDVDVSPGAWRQLPQRAGLDALLTAARRYYRVPEGVGIAAAPGSQALLHILPSVAPPGDVAVLGPTYAEHERIWRGAGRPTRGVTTFDAAAGAAVSVIVNPNNPDGGITAPNRLLDLARRRADTAGLVIVDEAFADLEPAVSAIPDCQDAPIVVLRSFGKFFGLPGLRLGFAVGPPQLIARIRESLGPWPVSGPALEIGARALGDEDWIDRTRRCLRRRCAALDDLLRGSNLELAGGTDLFRLVAHEHASQLHRHLGAAGIFTRVFDDRPDWIRLGIPGSDADLARLAAALSGYRAQE